MKSCTGRDDQLPSHRELGANIHVHSGPQLQTRIGKHQPNRERARVDVQLRKDVIHASVEDSSGIRIDRDLRGITRFDLASIALEYLGEHPNFGKVSYGVQHGFGLHVHIGQGVFLGDVTRDGRINRQIRNHLSV